jgi:hypothetical protein
MLTTPAVLVVGWVPCPTAAYAAAPVPPIVTRAAPVAMSNLIRMTNSSPAAATVGRLGFERLRVGVGLAIGHLP